MRIDETNTAHRLNSFEQSTAAAAVAAAAAPRTRTSLPTDIASRRCALQCKHDPTRNGGASGRATTDQRLPPLPPMPPMQWPSHLQDKTQDNWHPDFSGRADTKRDKQRPSWAGRIAMTPPTNRAGAGRRVVSRQHLPRIRRDRVYESAGWAESQLGDFSLTRSIHPHRLAQTQKGDFSTDSTESRRRECRGFQGWSVG